MPGTVRPPLGHLDLDAGEFEEFEFYVERFENYVESFEIAPEKKVCAFLWEVGAKAYKIIRRFCLPEIPITKSFEDLIICIQSRLLQEGERQVSAWERPPVDGGHRVSACLGHAGRVRPDRGNGAATEFPPRAVGGAKPLPPERSLSALAAASHECVRMSEAVPWQWRQPRGAQERWPAGSAPTAGRAQSFVDWEEKPLDREDEPGEPYLLSWTSGMGLRCED